MTAGVGLVGMRWMRGLAPGCPGAVNLTTVGPLGPMERAVTFPEALTVAALIDLLCPAPSHIYDTVNRLVANQPTLPGQER